ncbi:hypothetical protein NVP1084O_128 [Vibrio phage 1.084.O._10N.261.49.F5]|nr:hypothetical protein NVP1084O_128 [Vibrio phage 1.084.O._10N.261.49.F5]
MAKTLPDIYISSEDGWVDLSSASSIPEGTRFDIQVKTSVWVLLHESNTKPSDTETSGRLLSNFPQPTSKATIPTGSLKIWAKARPAGAYTTAVLSLQEV